MSLYACMYVCVCICVYESMCACAVCMCVFECMYIKRVILVFGCSSQNWLSGKTSEVSEFVVLNKYM